MSLVKQCCATLAFGLTNPSDNNIMVFSRFSFSGRTAVASLAVAATLVFAAAPVQAQQISDAKQKLIQQILTMWHPEDVPVMMVQSRATNAMQQSRIALQGKVSGEKRDATLRDIATDVQKYVDEVTPIAKDSAKRQLNPVIVPMLAQNFTEDELRQI
ncbi:MAG: hypothetical protein KGI52_16190, partial [Burkholderiales bacterium]|nr:hypothetical protein [Burkholderiales bacterium]